MDKEQEIRAIFDKWAAAIKVNRSTVESHHGRNILMMLAVIMGLQMISFGNANC